MAEVTEMDIFNKSDTKKKPLIYKCGDCDKIFNNFRYYQRHVEGHISNNCTQCNEKFTHRKHLQNHMFHAHNIGENACFQCTFCSQKYVKRITLITHIAKNHADGKFPCLECAEMFDSQEEHDIHTEEHNKQKPYSCDRCGSKFHRKQQYFVHLNQHDKYECVTCNKKYADKKSANDHKKLGHNVQGIGPRFKCDYCPKRLSTKSGLDNHLQTHQNELVYCSECDKTFICKEEHDKYHNKPRKKSSKKTIKDIIDDDFDKVDTHVCEICKKVFDKKFRLAHHIKVTHNEQEFNCSLCSHQSNNKLNLLEHMKLHLTVDRPFICDLCGKSFYRKNTLREHKNLVHNEVLQFSCEICGMQFKRSTEIKRHMQTHSNERPHVCNECGQSYKRKTHLTRHLNTTHGILTPQNKRLVQRLVKDPYGEFIPLNPASNINQNTSDVIPDLEATKNLIQCVIDETSDDVLNLISSTQCVDLIEQYNPTDSELWLVDNYSSTTSSDLTSVKISNTQESFPDQYLNHTNLQFDHIDTKDLIVLSSEQMLSVDAVVENSHKEDILLPDYLQTFYL